MSLTPSEIEKAYPWINHAFVQKYLSEIHEGAVVKSLKTESLMAKGENFCSNLIRIVVEYLNPPLKASFKQSFVLKADIETEATAEFNGQFPFFVKEIAVYADVMPLVQQLLDTHGISNRFWPRCYGTGRRPDYLLFEDLNYSGFRNVDKSLGLDLKHMELLMSRLALWHAATAVIHIMVSADERFEVD